MYLWKDKFISWPVGLVASYSPCRVHVNHVDLCDANASSFSEQNALRCEVYRHRMRCPHNSTWCQKSRWQSLRDCVTFLQVRGISRGVSSLLYFYFLIELAMRDADRCLREPTERIIHFACALLRRASSGIISIDLQIWPNPFPRGERFPTLASAWSKVHLYKTDENTLLHSGLLIRRRRRRNGGRAVDYRIPGTPRASLTAGG